MTGVLPPSRRGIGHGGIEAMTVSAASMALYLVFALCWNAGDTDALFEARRQRGDGADRRRFPRQIHRRLLPARLSRARERDAAAHFALRFCVCRGAEPRKGAAISPSPIGLHAIFDMPAALYQFGYVKQLFPVELWLAVCALYALRSARKCYLEECDA